jgi:hypothetical protein
LDGLKKLNLHNTSFDPTRLADYLAYGAFREFGVAAPRTGWADVSLNGTNLGLFTIVEQIDRDLIQRHFSHDKGALYKLEPPGGSLQWLGTNFNSYSNVTLQLPDSSDHESFIQFVNKINHEPVTDIARVLDLRGFLTYVAGCIALGNQDSFTEMAHNCMIYEHVPGRFTFLPWDLNAALKTLPVSLYPGRSLGWMGGNVTLTTNVLREPIYNRAYLSILYDFARGPASRERLQPRIDLARMTLSNRFDRPNFAFAYLRYADSLLLEIVRSRTNDFPPGIRINEVMSASSGILADNYGEYDDWIELYNPTELDFDLSGCFLSDKPDNVRKWRFPEGTVVPAGRYLLLWADEDQYQGPLHLNFKLSSAGETLVLTEADHRGNAMLDQFSFPALDANMSAGRLNTKRVLRISRPTPGESNLADTDGDGMPDTWEESFQLLVTAPDSNKDNDLDGISNLQEYQRGSDPLDAESPPKLEQFGRTSFRWPVKLNSFEQWIVETSIDGLTWMIHARPSAIGEYRGIDFEYAPGMRLYRLRALE